MLGDVGGFNGAIIILPAYLMAKYSESKYQASIQQEIPSRKTKQRRSKKKNNDGGGGQEEIERISQDDIKGIYKEVLDTLKNTKVRIGESLCYIGFLCKKSREKRMREKAAERFEESLDIRRLVEQSTNLRLLFRLLFTKE